MVGKNSPLAGIQTLPDNFVLALGTLASVTAVALNVNYGTGLTRSFLIKRLKLQAAFVAANGADSIVIGFARGDMTVAQISTALDTDINDPNDFDSWATMMQRNGILYQTLVALGPGGTGAAGRQIDVRVGGSKGLPMTAGEGVQLFAYNPGAALTTGSIVQGLFQLVGVWLDEIVAGA